jgi:hypothetical protein
MQLLCLTDRVLKGRMMAKSHIAHEVVQRSLLVQLRDLQADSAQTGAHAAADRCMSTRRAHLWWHGACSAAEAADLTLGDLAAADSQLLLLHPARPALQHRQARLQQLDVGITQAKHRPHSVGG